MNLNDYQQQAVKTAIYPKSEGITYTILGLSSEAGELAGKWKKIIRDKHGLLSTGDRHDIGAELGDVLWYIAMVAEEMGMDLDAVATHNLDKLASRANRGKLSGSGDNR